MVWGRGGGRVVSHLISGSNQYNYDTCGSAITLPDVHKCMLYKYLYDEYFRLSNKGWTIVAIKISVIIIIIIIIHTSFV